MERKRNYRDEREASGEDSSVVVGRNPVLELLSSGAQIEKIYIQRGEREGSVKKIFAEAKARGIPVSEADRHRLDTLAAGNAHQGVAAIAGGKGGGKPDSAMGGGNDLSKLNEALAAVESLVAEKI